MDENALETLKICWIWRAKRWLIISQLSNPIWIIEPVKTQSSRIGNVSTDQCCFDTAAFGCCHVG